jgi:hypothetical protein
MPAAVHISEDVDNARVQASARSRLSPGRTPEGRTTMLDEPKDRGAQGGLALPRLHPDHASPAAVMRFLATARDFLRVRLLERSRNSRRQRLRLGVRRRLRLLRQAPCTMRC